MELASKAQRKAAKYALYALEAMRGETEPCIDRCRRTGASSIGVAAAAVHLIHQSFLLMQQWIWNATTMSPASAAITSGCHVHCAADARRA